MQPIDIKQIHLLIADTAAATDEINKLEVNKKYITTMWLLKEAFAQFLVKTFYQLIIAQLQQFQFLPAWFSSAVFLKITFLFNFFLKV